MDHNVSPNDDTAAVIRQRPVKSLRRRDGLLQFAKNHTSQNGEDGIIAKLFELLPRDCQQLCCVDVGAWDGKHLSNTYSLLHREEEEWSAVLIEADTERCQELNALYADNPRIMGVNETVSVEKESSHRLENILNRFSHILVDNINFLSIDIDGNDYWVLYDLLKNSSYRPMIICIEFNPTMPNGLIYIPPRNDSVRHGCSLAALVELGLEHGYTLVETTLFNAFFVPDSLYQKNLRELVPDNSIEALHELYMSTSLYQLYDGTLKLHGCKKLLWHRIPITETQIQVIPSAKRSFPYQPLRESQSAKSIEELFRQQHNIVDISGLRSDEESRRADTADALLDALRSDGLCYASGTGISAELCQRALLLSKGFLHSADEDVRRSCLTKDRARRGYSPMATENFASLLGQSGVPNDLVRKFRLGPTVSTEPRIAGSSLLQPNVWPKQGEGVDSAKWDEADNFRTTLETFYDIINQAATDVAIALCEGLVREDSSLKEALQPIVSADSVETTSILTLLGYRYGTRHKGKNKGPLVAAHTDVSLITMLAFDCGSCSRLERHRSDGSWVAVELPEPYHCQDPIFVINVGDCLSDLSNGALPSTLHRVAAQGTNNKVTPRTSCALFVGLDPRQDLIVAGQRLSYENWRRQRIERAQSARAIAFHD